MARIAAADYHEIAKPSDPRVSPDGTQVAFVRTVPDDAESYEATIYVVSAAGDDLRRFTVAEGEDAEPRWSPSGDRIAFTSTRGAHDDRRQLWIVPTTGGEAWQVTDVVGGVSEIAWSPDGNRIAFVQQVSEEDRQEERDLSVADDYEPEDPDPRVVERTAYRSMEQYFDGRFGHLYVVDLESAPGPDAITRVTTGEARVESPRWRNGGAVYFADGWVGEDPDELLEYDVRRHDVASGETEVLHRATGWERAIDVTSDGRVLFTHTERERITLQQVELRVLEGDDVRSLTATHDRTLWEVPPRWGPEETMAYFATPDEGEVTVWSVPGDGSADPERVHRGGDLVGMDVGTGDVLALAFSEWNHPGDVFLKDAGAEIRRLTGLNVDYLERVDVQEPDHFVFESSQGPVEGWVLTPPEFDPEDTYPLAVQVHGGPHIMWTTTGTMWHEFQTLAARGYVVFWSNPRGSAGFGREYMQAIAGDWGAVTLTDVLAGVTTVAEREYVDEEAVFLTGGSFGGYLTGWTVGQTDRFAAVVAQRGLYDLIGFYGTTDGAYHLIESEFEATPWENHDVLWKHSPAAYAEEISTPTLLIHSDRDYRTPACTAELFYRILRKRGIDTRLVRYPREGHELSRSGEPGHIVDRIERIVRWFDGYSPHHGVPLALDRPDDAGLSGHGRDDRGDRE